MIIGLLCGWERTFAPAFIDRVNELGQREGIRAEYVQIGSTWMGEPARYSVIVDRISHKIAYHRAYLKHAVLQGTYVINNPFWWSADDRFFNYSIAQKLGVAVPRSVLLPQQSYPHDVAITPESLRNIESPIDWDALLTYVGTPAILKTLVGGGWEHSFKIHNREELLAAYDLTGPNCMVLQECIEYSQYVRCFTFGRTEVIPVAYDPVRKQYQLAHDYLTAELGARVVKDAQTINRALGYEVNAIEFAIRDGVAYAIDLLNPAPDFEAESITEFYFTHVVDRMARLVIDRALHGNIADTWETWEQMIGLGDAAGFAATPRARKAAVSGP